MLYKSLCCLGRGCLVLPSCWVTESPVSSSGSWSEEREGVSCLSHHMWHRAPLSLLWIAWFTSPPEIPVQDLAQLPALSVGRAPGRSRKQVFCVAREGMQDPYPCCDVLSDFRPLLFSVHDLSHCLHTSVVQAESVCTEVSCRTSLDLSGDGNKDFSKYCKKNKLCIPNTMGRWKRGEMQMWSDLGNKTEIQCICRIHFHFQISAQSITNEIKWRKK